MSKENASETLKRFAESAEMIQGAFLGTQTEMYEEGGGTKKKYAQLEKAVLDPGKALGMLDGWNVAEAKGQDFYEYLNDHLINFLNHEDFPEKDRKTLLKILITKGFFNGRNPNEFHINGLTAKDLTTWGQTSDIKDKKDKSSQYLKPEEVAKLDPFDIRKDKIANAGKDFLDDVEKTKVEKNENITDITATWLNPETNKTKEISINFQERLDNFKNLYKQDLGIDISPEQEKDLELIWTKNQAEFQKEIETYGYDHIILMLDNLPNVETLNEKLIESMVEPKGGKVAKTFQGSNFTSGGSFQGLKNTEQPKTRIILTKNIQNTKDSNDPYIQATLNKTIIQLTGLPEKLLEERIQNQEPLPINFKTTINNQEIEIRAEGLSLEEYVILQRDYFNKTGNHLDEKGATWLLKSLSGSRVVFSYWNPNLRQFYVIAIDSDYSRSVLGGRLSRSFSLV